MSKLLTSSETLGDMALLCYRSICKTDFRSLLGHIREFLHLSEDGERNPEREKIFYEKFLLGLDENSKLDTNNYSAVFAQTPNTDTRQGGDLLKRTFSAILLTIYLRRAGYFNQNADVYAESSLNENEELIAALLLRHIQSSSCNAYGISKVSGSDPRHLKVTEIGGATYPIISTTNHSCSSNVYRFNVGKVCIVKTLRQISDGEEILDSYGPHFATSSIEERKQILEGQYMFTCSCCSCVDDWPPYHCLPRENSCLSCVVCGIGLSNKNNDNLVCVECADAVDGKRVEDTFTECVKNYQRAKELLLYPNKNLKTNYEKIHDSIVAYANILEKTQKLPCQVLIECQETLKLCWNLQYSL